MALALVAFGAAPLGAQAPPGAELLVEIEERGRWLTSRQRPAHTPFRHERAWIPVDSIHAGVGGERVLYLRLPITPSRAGHDAVRLSIGRDGRVGGASAALDTATAMLDSVGARVMQTAHGRMTMGQARADRLLPRLWELVPTHRPSAARPGARWTDTLDHAAGDDADRRTLRGVRVSTLLGDTLVEGRRLRRVRDSAWVRLTERRVERDATLDTTVTIERAVEGVVVGRQLYDPVGGHFLARDDTAALAGEAVLRFPDGRSFRVPIGYERTRRWTVHEPGAGAERWAELDAAERRAARTPPLPSDHPPSRIALGDTALLHAQLRQRRRDRVPVDASDMRAMLAFMDDPGLGLAFDVHGGELYAHLRTALLDRPPAVTPDTARWPCTPDACRLLAAQWPRTSEPRLRELALIAAATLDPRRWADTVLAHAGSRFLEPAVQLVRGVGEMSPRPTSRPMPPTDAGWRAWRDWIESPESTGAARARPAAAAADRELAAGATHERAIRFHEAMTGRDIARELRAIAAAAASDSARLVTGALLHALGELRLADDEILRLLRTGPRELALLAERELRDRFRDPAANAVGGPLADSATTLAIHDRLVAHVVDGAPTWPALADAILPPRQQPGLRVPPAGRTVVLLADNALPALRERWKERIATTTAEEWNARRDRDAAVTYFLGPVRRVGRFVAVAASAQEFPARQNGSTPGSSRVHGRRWLLAEVDGAWVVVAAGY